MTFSSHIEIQLLNGASPQKQNQCFMLVKQFLAIFLYLVYADLFKQAKRKIAIIICIE